MLTVPTGSPVISNVTSPHIQVPLSIVFIKRYELSRWYVSGHITSKLPKRITSEEKVYAKLVYRRWENYIFKSPGQEKEAFLTKELVIFRAAGVTEYL